MKKTLYIIGLLTGILVTMTACSNQGKAENLSLSQEVSRVTQENEELKEEIQQLQQNNQKLDEEIAKLDPIRIEEGPTCEFAQNTSVFSIYGANVDTYEPELLSQVSTKDTIAIEQKLKIVAEYLSKAQFENLGIEVVKVEEEDGKKIATINLIERPNDNDISWQSGYFQGSTGGIVTTVSLQETFLQKEYQDEWIDGVTFLYEGEAIQFDHVESLGEITYR